ncbi:cytochrome c oxidase assembly protein [Halomonas cerina]|uniref:Cytochrome c oxidase assembly protein CtaG n=1 Tax=Halomonas cerina TaxID=447424 RepID=A0A839V9P1_9GAMM|nr:cytochrome c oxidase assembly protein [Halomonas cerina]MBB3191851.1 cytochrome c oxidase assembly protein subunit 11 [Halomonas cerina]
MSHRSAPDPRPGVRRTVMRTLVVLAGMFAFAFALVPLYDVFCQVTGLNGKTSGSAQTLAHDDVDTSRTVTMQFITRGSQGLPWQLESDIRQMRLHPGQREEVRFTFRNLGDQTTRARAVPSVSPAEASLHLRKLACFCFQEQQLAAGEGFEAPLVFQLTRDLPAEIKTVTLVYTLYPVQQAPLARVPAAPISEGDEA